MARLIIFLAVFFLFCNCTSLNEASTRYFYQSGRIVGVETPQEVSQRVNNDKTMRQILYKHLRPSHIIQCTILRNQLFVAGLKGLSGKEGEEIKTALMTIEKGFQQDDQAFLQACDAVMASRVGKVFIATQKNLLRED